MGLLTDGGGQKGPSFLKLVTHPTMMKLGTVIHYLKKIQKMFESRNTPWVLLKSALFSPEISNFCYIKKNRLRFNIQFLILLTFFESVKVVLISVVATLMMSAKLVTQGLLKIKLFWNEDYDMIISVHDVINKILSHDWNYIVDVIMWPKFGSSNISLRKVIIISIL